MKKVIVISTSLRRGSNSDMLADQFIEGAKAAGNEVEKISLVGKNIQFCKGCFGCQKAASKQEQSQAGLDSAEREQTRPEVKLGRCVINDDVNDIMEKVLKADVICWATRRRGPSRRCPQSGQSAPRPPDRAYPVPRSPRAPCRAVPW